MRVTPFDTNGQDILHSLPILNTSAISSSKLMEANTMEFFNRLGIRFCWKEIQEILKGRKYGLNVSKTPYFLEGGRPSLAQSGYYYHDVICQKMPCNKGDNIEISFSCLLSSLTKSNTTIFSWLDAQTFLEQTLSSEKLSRLALEHRSRLATKLSSLMKEYENHQMEMYIDMSPALKSFFHSSDASSSENGSEREQGKKKIQN